MSDGPMSKLRPEEQEAIIKVQQKLKDKTADFSDLATIMRVTQQNAHVLNPFGLTLILRIAELHFMRPEFVDQKYTLDSLNSAFGL